MNSLLRVSALVFGLIANISFAADHSVSTRSARSEGESNVQKMGETVFGKCAAVHVRPSKVYPARVRIYSDVPVDPANASSLGEVFYCGGSIEQCSTSTPGFDWVTPASAEAGKMAVSSFVPSQNERVTVLRVPPKTVSGARPCFEEISIGNVDANAGSYQLRSRWVGDSDTAETTFVAGTRANVVAPPRPQPAPVAQPQFAAPGGTAFVPSSDQAIAQARANALAAADVLTHSIGGAAIPCGVFEGIGMGAGLPATCVGPGPVVADAVAVGRSGLTYRVRFFQYNWRSSACR